ncbi:tyrosine-protein phosphatase [Paenibacillus faecalis]|uniref:tyrosine-protein phosphatase n=1 Tax=Paenibacillus faecalis TaxID=2079532 RepID=UPI000D0EF880|nr:CpsB/CapC family capsule biosynthesis tyrosine phosphatase [Paenibacillus faecalis]
MIDIHCHILPGIDDGPGAMKASLSMARLAVEQGIHTIIATPHHRTRRYSNPASRIKRRVNAFNAMLKQSGIPLTVLPGQEFHLTSGYSKEHKKGRLQTLGNTSYVLVELPSRTFPAHFPQFLSYMKRHQLRVVLAHPERNAAFVQNPDFLYEWLQQDVLLQITTQSLVGYFGRRIQKTAAYICRNRWAHFLASDAHNSFQRSFYFKEGYEMAEQLGGLEFRDKLQSNAANLISGKDISGLHSFSWQVRHLEQN